MSVFFSIVIPTYNRSHLLARTLDSVFEQSWKDAEILVVDDGSTDGTAEHLRSLGDSVRVLTQANAGPGAARNLGMQHARGEYVAFLDSDDLWFPWTLETFADLINRCERPAILGAKLMEFSEPEELTAVRREPCRFQSYTDYFESYRDGHYVGSGMSVLKRDVLQATGGFVEDRSNAEDHDLILRMGTAAGFVQVLSPVTLAWRRHSSSETADVRSTATGVLRLLRHEREGKYPGAAQRAPQRREILTSHARPASLGCLRASALRDGWRVYLATVGWHLRQGRWKYVAAFPVLALMSLFRSFRGVETS